MKTIILNFLLNNSHQVPCIKMTLYPQLFLLKSKMFGLRTELVQKASDTSKYITHCAGSHQWHSPAQNPVGMK